MEGFVWILVQLFFEVVENKNQLWRTRYSIHCVCPQWPDLFCCCQKLSNGPRQWECENAKHRHTHILENVERSCGYEIIFSVVCRTPTPSSWIVWNKWRTLWESWIGETQQLLDAQSDPILWSKWGSLKHAPGKTNKINSFLQSDSHNRRRPIFSDAVKVYMFVNVVSCSCGSEQENKVNALYSLKLPLVHGSVGKCLSEVVNVSNFKHASFSFFFTSIT